MNSQVFDQATGLLPHHLADLRRSGLTDETIVAAAIRSEQCHQRLAGILNRKSWSRKCGGAMVFPFVDDSGAVVLQRVKPDNPPKINGKPAKYLSPTDAGIRLYVPPAARSALTNTDQPLIIGEGEKKSLAGTQAGFPTVGLCGVDCWHSRRSSALLPDLDRIAWNGRTVYIAFDSDAAENENVQVNERLLATALAQRGASVRIVRFPPGPVNGDGKPHKQGLDDYLVAHGTSAFHALLAAASDPEQVAADELKQHAANLEPCNEAREYLETGKVDGTYRLRWWRGAYHLWQKGQYLELQNGEVRARLVEHLQGRFTHLSTRGVADVLEHLRALCLLAGLTEPPTWLTPTPPNGWQADEVLVARNGLVHMPSLVANQMHFIPPTPRFFTTVALDYAFNADAPQPVTWLEFLGQLWLDDSQAIEVLQEWLGYLLTQDTSQQKILLLVGPKRSGKGTIARIARALVGKLNVAGPTLASLATNFGLWPLVGIVVERLLSISGEDALTIDRKMLEPVTMKLPTRLMVLSNELPRLGDASGALSSRFIVLQLMNSFYGKEDHTLTTKLLAELPGILLWSIIGWKRLRERGRFVDPDSSKELVEEFEGLTSPIGLFLKQCCHVGPQHNVPREELYKAFVAWCEQTGRKHVEDSTGFGRSLRAAISTLRTSQHRIDGNPQRFYEGVGLRR